MKSLNFDIAYYINSPFLRRYLKVFFRIILPKTLNKKIRNKNTELKNLHSGETCFILGTGPSINTQDLTKLENKFCIGVGEFFHHKQYKVIAPQYYVQAPNHEPFRCDYALGLVRGVRKLDSNPTIILGHTDYKYSFFRCLKSHDYLADNIYFVNYQYSNRIGKETVGSEIDWDISKTPFTCKTVIYMALQVAIFMGFKKIVLLGCDHDYIITALAQKNFDKHHFYEESESSSKGIVDFLDGFTLLRWFREYSERWEDYININNYAISKGVRIINATNGSLLDMFERKKLEDIIGIDLK